MRQTTHTNTMSACPIRFAQLLLQGEELAGELRLGLEKNAFARWLAMLMREAPRLDWKQLRNRSRFKTLSQRGFTAEEALDTLFFAASQKPAIGTDFYELAKAVAKVHERMETHGEGAKLAQCMMEQGLEILGSVSGGGGGGGARPSKAHRQTNDRVVHYLQRSGGVPTTFDKILQIRADLKANPRAMGARGPREVDGKLWHHILQEMHITDRSWYNAAGSFEDRVKELIEHWPGVVEQYANKYGIKPGRGSEERVVVDPHGRSVSVKFNEASPSPERSSNKRRGVLRNQETTLAFLIRVAQSMRLLRESSRSDIQRPSQALAVYGGCR